MAGHRHEWRYAGVKYLVAGLVRVKGKARFVIYLDLFYCVKCLERSYYVLDRDGTTAEPIRHGAAPVYETDVAKLLEDFCELKNVFGWVPRQMTQEDR